MSGEATKKEPQRATKALAGKPCPICAKPSVADFVPFCSRRCADVDLHRWLKGTYVIPGAERAGSGEDGEE